MRAYLLVAVILLFIFGGIFGYLYQQYSTLAGMDFTPPLVTVAAGSASIASWEATLDAVGTIKATLGVQLSTEEAGEIISIAITSGSKVKAGDLLLTLNDKVAQASRERQVGTAAAG